MLHTVRVGKVDEKIGVICIVAIFCNFMLTSARNLSLLKQYESERSRYAFSEDGIVYYAMLTVSEIFGFKVEEICEISAESASFLIF